MSLVLDLIIEYTLLRPFAFFYDNKNFIPIFVLLFLSLLFWEQTLNIYVYLKDLFNASSSEGKLLILIGVASIIITLMNNLFPRR